MKKSLLLLSIFASFAQAQTSNISVSESTNPTKRLATQQITEDGVAKQLGRTIVTDVSGAAQSVATSTLQTAGNASLSNIDGKLPSLINSRLPTLSLPTPNDQGVTVTGAAGAVTTLTIPSVSGQYHYIDMIDISLYSAANRVGGATPLICTTDNLPGNPRYNFSTAAAIGIIDKFNVNAQRPIKSSVVNTATKIDCPAAAGGIWRINVLYFTGS